MAAYDTAWIICRILVAIAYGTAAQEAPNTTFELTLRPRVTGDPWEVGVEVAGPEGDWGPGEDDVWAPLEVTEGDPEKRMRLAEVACRQMGLLDPDAGYAYAGEPLYESASGYTVSNVTCTGSELSIADCEMTTPQLTTITSLFVVACTWLTPPEQAARVIHPPLSVPPPGYQSVGFIQSYKEGQWYFTCEESSEFTEAVCRFVGYEHGTALSYDTMPSELQDWYYTAEPRYHHSFSSAGWSSSILDFTSTDQGHGFCGYAAVVQCYNGASPDEYKSLAFQSSGSGDGYNGTILVNYGGGLYPVCYSASLQDPSVPSMLCQHFFSAPDYAMVYEDQENGCVQLELECDSDSLDDCRVTRFKYDYYYQTTAGLSCSNDESTTTLAPWYTTSFSLPPDEGADVSSLTYIIVGVVGCVGLLIVVMLAKKYQQKCATRNSTAATTYAAAGATSSSSTQPSAAAKNTPFANSHPAPSAANRNAAPPAANSYPAPSANSHPAPPAISSSGSATTSAATVTLSSTSGARTLHFGATSRPKLNAVAPLPSVSGGNVFFHESMLAPVPSDLPPPPDYESLFGVGGTVTSQSHQSQFSTSPGQNPPSYSSYQPTSQPSQSTHPASSQYLPTSQSSQYLSPSTTQAYQPNQSQYQPNSQYQPTSQPSSQFQPSQNYPQPSNQFAPAPYATSGYMPYGSSQYAPNSNQYNYQSQPRY